ncbi:MAG: hypothetical protein ABIJ00_12740 [Candidatus Eisenbacteria bacterium]
MKSCNAFTVRRFSTILVVLSLGVLVFSCADHNFSPIFKVDPGGPVYTRTTPDNLLEFLADAYEREDIDAYSEALHPYFEFEFTVDIADSLGLPRESPWWGKEEDIQSTRNMFDDPDVIGIEMHLDPFGAGSAWEDCWRQFIWGDPPETTLIQGLCQVFEPGIKVHIQEPGEELWIFWVHESLLDIMVTPDPEEEGLWVVLRIKETRKYPVIHPQGEATVASSWGSIKAMFRE